MQELRHSVLLTIVTQYLLLFLVANLGPILIGEFFKLLVAAACACLLVFVAVHSAKVCTILLARLQAVACLFLACCCNPFRVSPIETELRIPNEPCLAVAFQRPPPGFSY